MGKDEEIQSVIDDAFLVNGCNLVSDDEYVAVLVMQRRFFNKAVNRLLNQTTSARVTFLTDFNAKADEVIAAVEKVEKLRKDMLLEVLQSNEDAIAGIEERVQGSVSARLQNEARQVSESDDNRFAIFDSPLRLIVGVTLCAGTVLAFSHLFQFIASFFK